MRIKSLSSAVANQIAAGEVIENPASVVKELLENALDAAATAITIDIGFGGLNQIKISDNGAGIMAEDLSLAIAPHATSKLTVLSDLSTLTSMGFRGEALASIASVSRISISSKPAFQAHAMMLQADGEALELSPCARSQGTTIDVRDLFYNAPVRRRFLKSERSEYLSIEQIVKRFALSAPEINLVLKHNGKLMLELPAASHEQSLHVRIQRLLGKPFIEQAIPLDVERAGMHLTGWISGPAYQRSQNDKQWIYLNQRMVKDKLIQHAFKQAYETRLYPGRYPACLLYLSIPTEDVDVNVHPTKHEVRFQQPRLVHDFIGSQITQALMSVATEETLEIEPCAHAINTNHDLAGEHAAIRVAPIREQNHWVNPVLRDVEGFCSPRTVSQIDPQQSDVNTEVHWEQREAIHPHAAMVLKEQYMPRSQRAFSQPRSSWMLLNPQFGLLTWNNQSYLFAIQPAQQQRCLASVQQQALPLASRPLLVPVSLEHNIENIDVLHTSLDACRMHGIHIEMNDTCMVVRTLPVSMPQLAIKPLLQQVLELHPTTMDMPQLLVRCQPTDALQMDAYEKDALSDYIIQQLEQKTTLPWCVCLDIANCQELLRVE